MFLTCCLLLTPAKALAQQPDAFAAEEIRDAVKLGLAPEELRGKYKAPVSRAEFCSLALALLKAWGYAPDQALAERGKSLDRVSLRVVSAQANRRLSYFTPQGANIPINSDN